MLSTNFPGNRKCLAFTHPVVLPDVHDDSGSQRPGRVHTASGVRRLRTHVPSLSRVGWKEGGPPRGEPPPVATLTPGNSTPTPWVYRWQQTPLPQCIVWKTHVLSLWLHTPCAPATCAPSLVTHIPSRCVPLSSTHPDEHSEHHGHPNGQRRQEDAPPLLIGRAEDGENEAGGDEELHDDGLPGTQPGLHRRRGQALHELPGRDPVSACRAMEGVHQGVVPMLVGVNTSPASLIEGKGCHSRALFCSAKHDS